MPLAQKSGRMFPSHPIVEGAFLHYAEPQFCFKKLSYLHAIFDLNIVLTQKRKGENHPIY